MVAGEQLNGVQTGGISPTGAPFSLTSCVSSKYSNQPAGDRATAKVANVVGGSGLEQLTSCVSSKYSNQLSGQF